MYGGILVDPAEPLPPVEHELYMVQSEFYTMPGAAEGDPLVTDRAALTNEQPTYVLFNGLKGALVGENAPRMRVGERMRIYFVNAGLNLISSFHAIGSHWDKVYPEGTLLGAPLRGSQTTLVPAGGSTIVELVGQVPATLVAEPRDLRGLRPSRLTDAGLDALRRRRHGHPWRRAEACS
jgi:nitrite reductase (NO-forming)